MSNKQGNSVTTSAPRYVFMSAASLAFETVAMVHGQIEDHVPVSHYYFHPSINKFLQCNHNQQIILGSQDSPWLILIGCLAGINATSNEPCLTRVHQVYEAQILVFQREICFLNPNIDVKAMKTSTINYINLSTTKTTRTLPANQVHLPMFIIFPSSISMFTT